MEVGGSHLPRTEAEEVPGQLCVWGEADVNPAPPSPQPPQLQEHQGRARVQGRHQGLVLHRDTTTLLRGENLGVIGLGFVSAIGEVMHMWA